MAFPYHIFLNLLESSPKVGGSCSHKDSTVIKDLNSTVAKRGSVFIELMTLDGTYNRVQISKGCLNEVIIISLQEVIKRPLKDNIPVI